MPITELLEENARKYGNDVALVEVNPQVQETRRVLWKDYDLIQPTSSFWYRREITWHVFDEKANRFAQLLMSRGVKKGDKVAILLMNCLEWLPIYFGTLKTGALAVPMNFRYSAEEIEYCLDLAEADVLVFGPEFIGRIETIAESISKKRILFYVGGDCPSFAEDYDKLTSNCASISPGVPLTDEDDAASEAYTKEQFALFTRVLDALTQRGRTFAIRHCANSGALVRYPEMYLDMVRPGIALYGVGADAKALDLRPVMSLKSTISTIKVFDPDTDISYGRTFRTTGKTRVGVLPIGYADGLFRGLSNRMSVVTDAGPAPQRGRICMDMSMIDLTGLPDVKVGAAVEIFGRRQSVNDLAAILGTIPYELTCAVSRRVPRVYIEDGRVVERSLHLL